MLAHRLMRCCFRKAHLRPASMRRRKVNRHREWLHQLDKRVSMLDQRVAYLAGDTSPGTPRLITDDQSTPLALEDLE